MDVHIIHEKPEYIKNEPAMAKVRARSLPAMELESLGFRYHT